MKIAVYTPNHSNRLQYAFEELIRYSSVDQIIWIHNEQELPSDIPVINYSDQLLSIPSFTVVPSGLLGERATIELPIEWHLDRGLPYAFSTNAKETSDWHFDLPALLFYALSRLEEYGISRDEYGRATGADSMGHQQGWLTIPYIDLWRQYFFEAFNLKLNQKVSMKDQGYFEFTMDVDMAYAFKCQNLFRTLGALLKDGMSGSYRQMRHRWSVICGKAKDPFDTFDSIRAHFPAPNGELIFFFLLSNGSAEDRSCSPSHPDFRRLIKSLDSDFSVGIHPSLRSSDQPQYLKLELDRFKDLLDKSPRISRQHFLRLAFPDTYRAMLASGIKHDYTMGYHDVIGYRAGSALPFRWYDLEEEQGTDLMIHPFFAMDVTLKKYMNVSPDKGLTILKDQINYLKYHHLPFSCLWHNSSMSEVMGWQDWAFVPEELLTFLKISYS